MNNPEKLHSLFFLTLHLFIRLSLKIVDQEPRTFPPQPLHRAASLCLSSCLLQERWIGGSPELHPQPPVGLFVALVAPAWA